MSYHLGLLLTFSLAMFFWLVFLWLIRGISYLGPNTDNKFLAEAATQSSRWKWLSDLHKFSPTKTGMMEMTVIGLALFQKLFRDKKGDFPYMAWGGFCTALSAIFVYLISASYWSPLIGLEMASLLIVSFWFWQIALYGGHANTGAVFTLLSIYLVQQTNLGWLNPASWLFLGGVVYGLTQFSSRSATKYTPLFLAAVFYEKYKFLLKDQSWTQIWPLMAANFNLFLDIIIPCLAVFSFLIIKLTYKKAVTAMYFKKAPAFLNKLISSRDKFDLNFYLQHAKNKVDYYIFWASSLLITFLLAIFLLGWNFFWPILGGFMGGLLLLAWPDLKTNFKYFINILLETQIRTKSHFRLYVDYFAKKGIRVSRQTQGGGWIWLPKIFFRMAPFHTVLFLVSVLNLAGWMINGRMNIFDFSILVLLALSPILWGKITRAPQISRTFSPGLISMLLLIGVFFSKIKVGHLALVFLVLIPTFAWNLWKFLNDVYPARMTPANLTKKLLSLSINEISTYDTEYNNSVVKMIDTDLIKDLKVNYIKSLSEVKNGWIVIPGTSSKAMQMSSERESIREGDFTKDPVLNKLIETKKIEKIATAKFKALGNSNIWIHESEVASYRDLILHEIDHQDRFRGYVWLINAKNLEGNFNL